MSRASCSVTGSCCTATTVAATSDAERKALSRRIWATWVEVTATICPLTPLENALRRRAGEAGYPGGFVEHYVLPLLYPAGLTPGVQAWLGAFVVGLNAAIYAVAILRWRRSRR